jgi:hypothetical protein
MLITKIKRKDKHYPRSKRRVSYYSNPGDLQGPKLRWVMEEGVADGDLITTTAEDILERRKYSWNKTFQTM